MTLKKKTKDPVTGEERVVESVIGGPLLQLITGTGGFRILIFLFVASMHPLGRSVLGTFGFKFPDERNLVVAAEEAKSAKGEIAGIAESMKEIKADVASLKANNAIINSKVDNMEQTFRGFQIDFAKWKPQPKPE